MQTVFRCAAVYVYESNLGGRDTLAAALAEAQDLAPATSQVVIGSDVVYERGHTGGLAAALARHLAPQGVALLCCPVREQACCNSIFYSRACCNCCNCSNFCA